MTKYTITEYDVSTGIETTRDLTLDEIAELPEATNETPSPS